MTIVQTCRREIAALRRLGKTAPNDPVAQASIAGQINALMFVISRASACFLACAFILVAGNAFALDPATFRATTLAIDSGTKTAAATAGAATLSKGSGVITSEALTTAAGATYTLTLTNTAIAAADIVFASVANGTATTGTPVVTTVKPAAGSVVIIVQNIHASAAVNGTLKIAFAVLKP